MKIVMFGVTHDDPLSRPTLRAAMLEAMRDHGVPRLIGIEWGEETFRQALAQREQFRRLARWRWPRAPEKLISALACTIGHEGDTHSEILPNVDILFLDDARVVEPAEKLNLDTRAERFLVQIRAALRDKEPLQTPRTLLKLSEEFAGAARRGVMPNPFEHDALRALAVHNALGRDGDDDEVLFLVNGFKHLAPQPESLFTRLDADFEVVPRDLCPAPS